MSNSIILAPVRSVTDLEREARASKALGDHYLSVGK